MQYILFEDERVKHFFPLTHTKPFALLRVGMNTFAERWADFLGKDVGIICRWPLSEKFNCYQNDTDSVFINSRFVPDAILLEEIRRMEKNTVLMYNDDILAVRCLPEFMEKELTNDFMSLEFQAQLQKRFSVLEYGVHQSTVFQYITDLFGKNGQMIRLDFERNTKNRVSQRISDPYTRVYGEENVFVEEGVKIRCAVINAESGPVFISKNAEIQENSVLYGPLFLGEHAVINIGAKIRGDTSIGHFCKVGGEVSNTIFQAYSNKAHDGFVGNSYIGEWCNLGADTNTSNLKNNYGNVKIFSEAERKEVDTKLQFCGTIMGDHSKTGINTMLNTGTVVGVAANIFGGGFPPKFIPSFAWGGADGFQTFLLEKCFEVAERMMKRRGVELSEADKKILSHVYHETLKLQTWQKF